MSVPQGLNCPPPLFLISALKYKLAFPSDISSLEITQNLTLNTTQKSLLKSPDKLGAYESSLISWGQGDLQHHTHWDNSRGTPDISGLEDPFGKVLAVCIQEWEVSQMRAAVCGLCRCRAAGKQTHTAPLVAV